MVASSSRASQDISATDSALPEDENGLLVPQDYSTFFESSSLEFNRVCNHFKPMFVAPTNFFPGDDIDEDIPWIGEKSIKLCFAEIQPRYNRIYI